MGVFVLILVLKKSRQVSQKLERKKIMEQKNNCNKVVDGEISMGGFTDKLSNEMTTKEFI